MTLTSPNSLNVYVFSAEFKHILIMACCICRLCDESSVEEIQPLVAETAKSARPQRSRGVNQRVGKINAHRVGVPDLDQRFTDIADTYNEQQDNYKCMKKKLQDLADRYHCARDSRLSICLEKIRQEHDRYHIRMQLKGYYFSLSVMPADDVPAELRITQEQISALSQATMAVDSTCTRLQPMIDSYLRDREGMTARVRESALEHQEQQRFEGNLQTNLQEAERAKESSVLYREEARELLREAALLSGIIM